MLVGLEAPEPGSADMFTDLAWIDPSSGLYWAHRSGGFAGVSLWVGPFPARIVTDEGPTEVRPARARTPRRTRRRNLLIRRDIASAQENPRVRRRDYAPEDFDFGQGIRVVRVLRANRRLIRVRIEISSDAVPGQRAVLVKGALGDALFTLE